MQANLIISGSIFNGNAAQNGGALTVSVSYNIQLHNSTFIYNEATAKGGVLYHGKINPRQVVYNNITTAIINCTFMNNFGVTGGAISSYSSNLHIYNSTFISNFADFGGAIETESGLNFSLLLCNFTANEATVRGGAISIYSRFVYIESNNFFYNSGEVGGAIHMRQGFNFIITRCRFKDNFGYNAGALGVFSLGFTSIVSFSSNQANFNGGAIYVMAAFPLGFTITNCTFVNNSAKHSGGALEAYSSRLEIYGSLFLQNSAKLLETVSSLEIASVLLSTWILHGLLCSL